MTPTPSQWLEKIWHWIYHTIICPANKYINSSPITSFSDIIPGTVWGPVPSEITSTSSGISSCRDSWELASASPSWAMLVRLRLRAAAGGQVGVNQKKIRPLLFLNWYTQRTLNIDICCHFTSKNVGGFGDTGIHVSPNNQRPCVKLNSRELRLFSSRSHQCAACNCYS